ncbi:MAG: hypothetical protein ABJB85_06085 [Nitrososphaerota archaeon]
MKGEVRAGVNAGTFTTPPSVVMSLLSLSYNAAYILTEEMSFVELFTIVPVMT